MISHIVAGILLSLALYIEDPDRVGDTVNIFLFTDLYLSSISEATLVESR